MPHIMLDLETLDTKVSSVVLSIGAVAFNPETKTLGDRFYLELVGDLEMQQLKGRTIGVDTVRWWMQQDQKARELFTGINEHQSYTEAALTSFSQFVADQGRDACVWGNGVDFDNAIMRSLYDSFGYPQPWRYTHDRCYRTVKNLLGSGIPLLREGTHHNALDDAVSQAKHLMEVLSCVKSQ